MAKKKTNKQPWSSSLESREALYKGVNPSADFDPLSIATQTIGYLGGFRTGHGMPEDEARWAAYLGLPYDKTYAPDTKIRFEGDENYPDRQYQGLSKRAKEEVRKKIIPQAKRIKDKYNKEWIQVLDTKPNSEYNDATIYHDRQNYLGDLGKFGIREVGESGIYEVGDKYDFPALIPIPDRNKGTELMVRDTIWSDRANPKLYNQEVIKRKNRFDEGGDKKSKSIGQWFNDTTSNIANWNTNTTSNFFGSNFGQGLGNLGLNAGNIGGIANTAATAIGGAIAGGKSSGVGNTMQSIGSLASNIPGVGGLIGAGVNLLGGITNAAFGSKMNEENINNVNSSINQALSYTSNASDYDALSSNYANLQGVMGFDKDYIGSDGWFSNKAKKKYEELKRKAKEAEQFQMNTLENNAQNIANTNQQLLEANYSAYGGPIDMKYTGVMSPFGNQFKDGGIYIKPSKRGTFTAAAKKRGMGVQEFASKVLANKEDYSPTMVKKANFARNASRWKHADGGPLEESIPNYRPNIKRVTAMPSSEDIFSEDVYRASKGNFQDVLSDSANKAADFMSSWYTGRKATGKFDDQLDFIENRAKLPTFIKGVKSGSGAADYSGSPTSNTINVNPAVTITNWGEEGIHRGDYVSRLLHEMTHASSMYNKNPNFKDVKSYEASPTLKKLQAYMGDDFNLFPTSSDDTENAAEYYPRLMQMREAMNADPSRTDYTEKELNPWLKKFGLPTGEKGVWMMNNLVDANNNNLGRSRRVNSNDFTNDAFIAADGGPLDTKSAVLKKLKDKRNSKGRFKGGNFGGAGATSLFFENPDDYSLVKDTIWVPYRETFNDAFGRARAAGLDEFMFDGKAYTTELGDNPDNNRAGEERAIEGLLPVERTRQVKNKKAEGGELFTNGVTIIGNGGTHESNPYEGVQMGVDPQGIPNLVEEGEVIYNGYVYSNRLRVPKEVRQKYKLRGVTFADAAKQLQKESEERPNDPISKRGLNAAMSMLQQEQEAIRMKKESNKYAKGGKLGRLYDGTGGDSNWLYKPMTEGYTPSKDDILAEMEDKYSFLKKEELPIASLVRSGIFKKPESTSTNSNSNWLRYAPIAGHAIGAFSDLFSSPDYSAAETIEAVDVTPATVGYTPVGNYLSYKPFDRDYYLNKLNADAAASRRAITNTSGGNRAAAMAGLLATDYNYGNQLGVLSRQAEEYNQALRERVEGFNRQTNLANTEMGLKAAMTNAESRNQATRLRLSQAGQVAAMRKAAKDAYDARRSNNINVLLEELGGLGTENWNRDWLDRLAKAGVLKIDSKGNPVISSAKGGKIRTKKKKGFTYG